MIQNQTLDISTINDLAKAYFDKKDFESALHLLNRDGLPVELIPNLAKCHYYTNNAPKAIELIKPLKKSHDLWIDLAIYYNAIGKHDKAFEIYKTLDNTDPKVKFNIGWHYLRNGDFVKGFENIQYGNQCRTWGHEYIHLENGTLK